MALQVQVHSLRSRGAHSLCHRLFGPRLRHTRDSAADRVAVGQPRHSWQHIGDRLKAAVRVRREALWHDDLRKERPEKIKRPERVPVVHEEYERIRLLRVELHRAHAAAEGVLELVRDAAERAGQLRQYDLRHHSCQRLF